MNLSDVEGVLAFLRAAEKLKNTRRSAWTSAGEPESVAQHTWRLSLMAMVIAPYYVDLDVARLLKICIVHDLGEAIRGDIPAIYQIPGEDKAAREREDLLQLIEPLPRPIAAEILSLWDEYEATATREAELAKALDKLETILQHNQGDNPSDFDYAFNLAYGLAYTVRDPVIATIREILDRETAERARQAGQET